jgi:hypothetical protein
MYSFAHEVLNRVRTPSEALADLLVRYQNMESNHPDRPKLGAMIDQLAAEVTGRVDLSPSGAGFNLRSAA